MSEIYIKAVEENAGIVFTLHPKCRKEGEILPQALCITGIEDPQEGLQNVGGSVAEKLSGVGIGELDSGTSAIFYFQNSEKYYEMPAPIRGNMVLHHIWEPDPPPAKALCSVEFPVLEVSQVVDPHKLESLNTLFEKS